MDNGNGGNGVQGEKVAVLQLSFTPRTFKLDIGGSVENIDIALAMLEQAKRHFEGELRAMKALQLQQRMTQAAQDNAIAQSLRKH